MVMVAKVGLSIPWALPGPHRYALTASDRNELQRHAPACKFQGLAVYDTNPASPAHMKLVELMGSLSYLGLCRILPINQPKASC